MLRGSLRLPVRIGRICPVVFAPVQILTLPETRIEYLDTSFLCIRCRCIAGPEGPEARPKCRESNFRGPNRQMHRKKERADLGQGLDSPGTVSAQYGDSDPVAHRQAF